VPIRLLILNPNSSSSITSALFAALSPHTPPGVTLTFHNPSTGPPGIHDAVTAQQSTDACLSELTGASPTLDLEDFDGVLVSCFSEHPLISALSSHLASLGSNTRVLGMLHAGFASALLTPEPFGIIATGTGPKPNLIIAAANFLGSGTSSRFVGSLTTGLGVVELQEGDQNRVETNMKETTGRLVDLGAGTVVLGCAGMSGMDRWVIDAGLEKGKRVRVVDGARAGVEMLCALIRTSR
jgi:Asp/Glu/hydantoin racemase